MSGPFASHEVLVVASSDNVTAQDIGLINPILVEQDLIFAPATKTAVQNVVAFFQCLPGAFTDDLGAGTQLVAEDPETAELRLRSYFMDDSGNGRAVAKDVAAGAGHGGKLKVLFNNRKVVGDFQGAEGGVARLNACIEEGNFYALACAAA